MSRLKKLNGVIMRIANKAAELIDDALLTP